VGTGFGKVVLVMGGEVKKRGKGKEEARGVRNDVKVKEGEGKGIGGGGIIGGN